jgi:AcrR family transcriptional regulator
VAERRRLTHDERREAIFAVARESFSRRPYGEVSVAEIATAAGVSPPLIVFYYGSKRSLYVEVIRAAVTAIVEGLQAIPAPPSLDRLHAGARFYAAYALAHGTGFLSLLRGGAETSMPEAAGLVETLRAQVTAQIVEDVNAAASESCDEAEQIRLRIAVRGYLGFVDTAVATWLNLPDEQRVHLDPDTIATLAVGAFTGALTAVMPSTPPGTSAPPDPADC